MTRGDKPSEVAQLSSREAEVAREYVEGLSYKEIARALGISPGTIRTHLNTIYRKLGVSSRTELARYLSSAEARPAGKPVEKPAAPEALDPENRQITFVCAEIVGSRELVARLDPEDMHALASAFREAVAEVFAEFGGHLATFSGTQANGAFGWPDAAEDAPDRAARAALKLTCAAIGSADGSCHAVRVGVSTGMVVVEARDGQPAEFVGTAANLAGQLATAAPGGGVLITALTRDLVGRRFKADRAEALDGAGPLDPSPVFRLLSENLLIALPGFFPIAHSLVGHGHGH